MGNLFWLTEAQMARLQPCFPKSIEDQKTVRGTVLRRMGKPREFPRCDVESAQPEGADEMSKSRFP